MKWNGLLGLTAEKTYTNNFALDVKVNKVWKVQD